MQALAPDFFIGNGDLIYADGDCPAVGPAGWVNIPGDFPNITSPSVDWTDAAAVREVYLRHYRYNRADPFFQSFLRSTPLIAQWDDHEPRHEVHDQVDVAYQLLVATRKPGDGESQEDHDRAQPPDRTRDVRGQGEVARARR